MARVLVVEDSATQLEALRFVLEEQGFSIVAATSGEEALAAAAGNTLDLVISDIVMPGMDGYALCKALRADGKLCRVPIILLTALSSPEDIIQALECGANGFLSKPYDDELLVAEVRRVLASPELASDADPVWLHSISYGGRTRVIDADPGRVLALLLSTYESAVHRNTDLVRTREELRSVMEELEERVGARTAELTAEVSLSKALYVDLETEKAEGLRAKDELLAQVAHELRTPLGAAFHFVTLLREGLAGSINQEQSQYLEVIARNMKHMRGMISDLTDVSRSVAGKLAVKQERMDVAPLIHRVVVDSRPKAAMRGMTISVGIEGEIPPVYADDARVTQVLTNLLDNAIKFAPPGSSISIGASCRMDDPGFVALSVHDEGTSLTPEIAERVFQRLFQGTQEASESRQGLGLGLFISQQIVSLHGGRIWVDIDPAEGPTFMFTLHLYDLAGVLHPIVSSSDWLESPHTLLLVATASSTVDRIPEVEWAAIRTRVQTVVKQCIRPDFDRVLPAVAGIPAGILPVICKVDARGAAAIATRIENGWSREGATIGTKVNPRVTLVGDIPRSVGGQAGTYEAARAAARWLEGSIDSYVLEERRGPNA